MVKELLPSQPHEIQVENAGPIKELRIVLGEPGIYEVRGPNGCGKTTLVDAVDVLTGHGQNKPSRRDGTTEGKVAGLGVTLRLGKVVTRRGKVDILRVEGQSALARLIDPGLKTPALADAERTTALIEMVGKKADLQEFLGLAPEVAELVKPEEFEENTPFIQMAEVVRARLHEEALLAEKSTERLSGAANASRTAAEGVDVNVETSPTKLQEALDTAERAKMRLESERDAADAATDAAQEARQKLAEIPVGKSVEECEKEADKTADIQHRLHEEHQAAVSTLTAALENAEFVHKNEPTGTVQAAARVDEITELIKEADAALAEQQAIIDAANERMRKIRYTMAQRESELRSAQASLTDCRTADKRFAAQIADIRVGIAERKTKYEQARQKLKTATEQRTAAEDALTAARQNAKLRATCEAQIAAGEARGPTAEQMGEARAAVQRAKDAIERGILARRAKEQLAEAERTQKQANEAAKRCSRLRQAAWDVDKVLAAQIESLGTPVTIKDGRMLATVGGRKVFVHDLSPGERAQLFGVPFVKTLGTGGLGTVDQRTWLQLDGRGKRDFERLVREAGCYVIAEGIEEDPDRCDDPVSVEKFSGPK